MGPCMNRTNMVGIVLVFGGWSVTQEDETNHLAGLVGPSTQNKKSIWQKFFGTFLLLLDIAFGGSLHSFTLVFFYSTEFPLTSG